MLLRRAREPAVGGDERRPVRLRERDVHRVKGAEVVAQIQNAAEERLVALTLEGVTYLDPFDPGFDLVPLLG